MFHPEIDWYAGFSGVLHGLFAAAALNLVYLQKNKQGWILLLLLISKLLWEAFFGPMPGSEDWTGAKVVSEAHFYGAVSGALFFLLNVPKNRFSPTEDHAT